MLRIALRRRAPAAMDAEKSAEFEHSDECEDSAGEGGRGPGAGPRVFSETAPGAFLSCFFWCILFFVWVVFRAVLGMAEERKEETDKDSYV